MPGKSLVHFCRTLGKTSLSHFEFDAKFPHLTFYTRRTVAFLSFDICVNLRYTVYSLCVRHRDHHSNVATVICYYYLQTDFCLNCLIFILTFYIIKTYCKNLRKRSKILNVLLHHLVIETGTSLGSCELKFMDFFNPILFSLEW